MFAVSIAFPSLPSYKIFSHPISQQNPTARSSKKQRSLPSQDSSSLPSSSRSGSIRVVSMGKGLFDLEKHFAFYGAYHSNPVNVLIHMLFVWPIFYSALLLFHFSPLPFGDGGLAFVFALIYALFYVLMDPKAGSLAALLCFLCWLGSASLASRLGFSLAWKVVLAAQLFCWTGQFIGHGVFEKRAPALLDNLSQAFLMAPFFVLLEALNFFGYEPYPGFHANVSAKIEAARKEWQTNKQKKSS